MGWKKIDDFQYCEKGLNMVRKYGKDPYKAAVIHGGPGALGSVACIAKELAESFGVIEPIQTKYSICDLILELHEQISAATNVPITLIGHSWGAWLVVLFANEYPDMVKQLVLVSSGPFKQEYVSMILERRLKNLSDNEGDLFVKSIEQLNDNKIIDKDTALNNLGRLAEKADNYDIIEIQEDAEHSFNSDGEIYSAIWTQADELRRNGDLFDALKNLKCPVVVVHGDFDAHPIEGVVEPLREQGVIFGTHILSKCGHSPFIEKYAKELFYRILRDTVLRY